MGLGIRKNPFNKQAGAGSPGQNRRLGTGMKKPGPNSTHCHSYALVPEYSVPIANPERNSKPCLGVGT